MLKGDSDIMIRVTVYNEFFHEKTQPEVKAIYPNGIHTALKEHLSDDEITVQTVTLDNVNDITDELLKNTDVLIWWGHMKHGDVPDEVAQRVQNAVLSGMGAIFLHSTHHSKPFKLLMGTPCSLGWREDGDREYLWAVDPSHPIADGVDRYIKLELILNFAEGLKIPLSSIIEKNCYIIPVKYLQKGGENSKESLEYIVTDENGEKTARNIDTFAYKDDEYVYYLPCQKY